MRTHSATYYGFAPRANKTSAAPWSSDSIYELGRITTPIGRALYALIFLLAVPGHFSSALVTYASQAGVPAPEVLVPLSGAMAGLGGLSILLGYRARIGALLIILFLIPVTLFMHNFWAIADPIQRQMQLGNFMKNTAMLGGALYMLRCGSGPFSLDRAISENTNS
jgi:putative oxidoreductase